jgi:hypothetical protein
MRSGIGMNWGLHAVTLIFMVACGGEDKEDLTSGAEVPSVGEVDGDGTTEEAGDAPSKAQDDGANPERVPIAGEGKERGRILGTIEVEGYTKGTIQLDAVVDIDGGAKVIANERYQRPGPFRLVVRGAYDEVNLIAYLDIDDDGPTAGDLRVEYAGNPIKMADGERIEGLVVRVVEDNPSTEDAQPSESGDEGKQEPAVDEETQPPGE